jgi:hypothetical protein
MMSSGAEGYEIVLLLAASDFSISKKRDGILRARLVVPRTLERAKGSPQFIDNRSSIGVHPV